MKLILADELELEKGEDAPMSMAADPEVRFTTSLVCARPQSNLCGKTEQNARLWHKQLVRQDSEWTERELSNVRSDEHEQVCLRHFFAEIPNRSRNNRLALLGTQGTLNSGDVDDYQARCSSTLLCVPAKLTQLQKVTVLSPHGILALIAGKQTVPRALSVAVTVAHMVSACSSH
jgi:hypothetical protein